LASIVSQNGIRKTDIFIMRRNSNIQAFDFPIPFPFAVKTNIYNRTTLIAIVYNSNLYSDARMDFPLVSD